ncbi:hypothetical protein Tco_0976595 [Tanacetum coccineum]|uniref:Uncharacterized protein n=1 Tax=Tanacetum coccineum TaxID=301880 RepID=A0ABQ5EI11_9ASTR
MVGSLCIIFRGDKLRGIHVVVEECTKLKRPKNLEWFKEKMLLAQALEARVVLDEEQMAFLADDGERIATGQDTQALTTTTIL